MKKLAFVSSEWQIKQLEKKYVGIHQGRTKTYFRTAETVWAPKNWVQVF